MDKKVREDRTTEESEYQKAKHELKFRPDISKSQTSYLMTHQQQSSSAATRKTVKAEND